MLDIQHGIEQDTPPELDEMDRAALRVFMLLANGTGGIDWHGLPTACEYVGVCDVEGLLWRIEAIQQWRPPKERET